MSKYLHVRRPVVDSDVRQTVEFAALLDPIRSTSVPQPALGAGAVDGEMAFADLLVADMLDVAPTLYPAPIVPLGPLSRFADAGLDDDRLALRSPAKRFRRR